MFNTIHTHRPLDVWFPLWDQNAKSKGETKKDRGHLRVSVTFKPLDPCMSVCGCLFAGCCCRCGCSCTCYRCLGLIFFCYQLSFCLKAPETIHSKKVKVIVVLSSFSHLFSLSLFFAPFFLLLPVRL